jgi:hypothetical protein
VNTRALSLNPINIRYNFKNRLKAKKTTNKSQFKNKNWQSKCFLLHLTKMVPKNCLPSHISKFISRFLKKALSCTVSSLSCLSSTQDGCRRDLESDSSLDLTPPNKTPMLLNTSTECNLLTFASAHRRRKLQFCQVVPHSNYSRPCWHWSYVQH